MPWDQLESARLTPSRGKGDVPTILPSPEAPRFLGNRFWANDPFVQIRSPDTEFLSEGGQFERQFFVYGSRDAETLSFFASIILRND